MYFICVLLQWYASLLVSSAFTTFFHCTCYSMNLNRKLQLKSVATVAPLNYIINFAIAVSYNCHTRNQNSKETTP